MLVSSYFAMKYHLHPQLPESEKEEASCKAGQPGGCVG